MAKRRVTSRRGSSDGCNAEKIMLVIGLVSLGFFVSMTLRTGGFGWIIQYIPKSQAPSISLDVGARKQAALSNLSVQFLQIDALKDSRALPAVLKNAPAMIVGMMLPKSNKMEIKNVTDAVRTFLLQDVDFKPKSDQQEEEWNKFLVSFHIGQTSCSKICKEPTTSPDRAGGVCLRDWFVHLDRCGAAQSAFPQGRCAEGFRPSAPSFDPRTSEAMVSRDSKADPPTCDAEPSGARETRLCPCAPAARARSSDGDGGLDEVRAVVERRLIEREAFDRLELSRGVKEGVELSPDGVQMSSIFLENVKANRVAFFKGMTGATCEATCKQHGLKCQNRWFKELNQCEVLMAAWPQDRTGAYFKSCSGTFYGHDLPAYQNEMDKLLLNNDIEGFPTTCGGRSDHGARLCPCAYRYPNTRATFHTVFSVESKQYFEWQSRYNVFWHKQVGQAGKITRLLSMGGAWPDDKNPHPVGDHLMNEVPTHLAPKYNPRIDAYSAYNKPLAITHWLQNSEVKEDVIIIIDPDCAFVNKIETAVEEGEPVANQGYYTFKDPNSVEMQIAKHYCRGACKHFDPIAVPVIIHRRDLERLAPLWLKYTEDIRRDREGPNKWPIQWNDNRYTVNRIEWVAEMFGYVIAASHLDLRHEIADLQMVPSVQKRLDPGVPIIHFHIRIVTSDKQEWAKGNDKAGQVFPWPVAAGTDEVSTRMLTALHEAHEALGDTERYTKGLWQCYSCEWDNPQ